MSDNYGTVHSSGRYEAATSETPPQPAPLVLSAARLREVLTAHFPGRNAEIGNLHCLSCSAADWTVFPAIERDVDLRASWAGHIIAVLGEAAP